MPYVKIDKNRFQVGFSRRDDIGIKVDCAAPSAHHALKTNYKDHSGVDQWILKEAEFKSKQALAVEVFDKGAVLDALIALNKWGALKEVLRLPENETMKDRWDAHSVIKLNDTDVETAISAVGLDPDAIKLQIAGL